MNVTKRLLLKRILFGAAYSCIGSRSFAGQVALSTADINPIANQNVTDPALFLKKIKNKITLEALKSIKGSETYDYFFVLPDDVKNVPLSLYICIGSATPTSSEYVTSADGLKWQKYVLQFELSDFGAIGDGVTDSAEAIELALNSGLAITETKTYSFLLGRTINISDVYLNFTGLGQSKTTFLLNHYNNGIEFSSASPKVDKSAVTLKNFTIKRLNNALYEGVAGPKGVYVGNANPLLIEKVEECYGLGYGLHIDYSNNVVVRDCYVHDHKGQAAGLSGTDGIHFYRSQNVTAENNFVHDVGDDAISAGSYVNTYAAENISFLNNKIYSSKGGMKIYGFANNVLIQGNKVVGAREGGVYLTDDANSPEGSTVDGVKIIYNDFYAIGVYGQSDEGGALRIRFWPVDGRTSRITNVSFENNSVYNSRVGISELAYNSTKRLSNLHVLNNTFIINGNAVGVIKKYSIKLTQCDDILDISKNIFTFPTLDYSILYGAGLSELQWNSTAQANTVGNSVVIA